MPSTARWPHGDHPVEGHGLSMRAVRPRMDPACAAQRARREGQAAAEAAYLPEVQERVVGRATDEVTHHAPVCQASRLIARNATVAAAMMARRRIQRAAPRACRPREQARAEPTPMQTSSSAPRRDLWHSGTRRAGVPARPFERVLRFIGFFLIARYSGRCANTGHPRRACGLPRSTRS